MDRVLYLVFSAVLIAPWANAFESLRIASMTRGLKLETTDPEVLGGSLHPCYRTCVDGEVQTCVYSFTLAEYTTMSNPCGDCPFTESDCYGTGCITAGGDVRPVILVNHMLPGPSIQVCEGDIVQVNVVNTMASESSTIHWHGIHQIDTPYMDGVPFVTQCPIPPHTSFKYNFTASPSGTHIYHSHSGFQETDGLYGSFIIRKFSDPLSEYYDHDLSEHTLVVWHWFGASSSSVLSTGLHRSELVRGYSLTINGLAATRKYERDGESYYTPRAVFTVEKGLRFRFRLIANTAVYCPIQVSVDDHTLLVIATDGAPVSPIRVDTLIINAGERFDFVLTADQSVDNYWIRFRGLGNCDPTIGEAILRYNGAPESNPSGTVTQDEADRAGVLLNPIHEVATDYPNHTVVRLTELNSTATSDLEDVSGTPDYVAYVPFDFTMYRDFYIPGPYPQFNNITFEIPPIPLLTQKEEITPDMYCTPEDDSAKDCSGGYCVCPIIYTLPSHSMVEVILVDETDSITDDHPMHLHGQYARLVAFGIGNGTITVDEVKRLNEAGEINKKLEGAPLKDTIGVPAHGYAVLRFFTKNPGYWLLHCHVGAHSEEGMIITFKIGEHSDMLDPPADFPKCGNYDITANSK